MLKQLLLSLLLITSGLMYDQLQAQVFCTNETESPVWVAVAYNQVPAGQLYADGNMWVTEGWVYVQPNETIRLTTHLAYSKEYGMITNIFYYAYQDVPEGREWTGPRKFLIEATPKESRTLNTYDFRIEHANRRDYYKDNPNFQFGQFKGATLGQEEQYHIVLRQNDTNDPPMTAEEKSLFGVKPKVN